SRGRFAEAATAFQTILDEQPRHPRRVLGKKDDPPGTDAFFARARFNLGAALEKLGQLDAAAAEFRRVESGRVGPAPVAALQRARLLLRRGDLAGAETILMRKNLAKEPGRIEGLLHLLERGAEAGDGADVPRRPRETSRARSRATPRSCPHAPSRPRASSRRSGCSGSRQARATRSSAASASVARLSSRPETRGRLKRTSCRPPSSATPGRATS